MTLKTYDQIPSSAVDKIIVDTDTNQVQIVYKSNQRSYTYSTENAEQFDQMLLTEFADGLSNGYVDVSIGKLVNNAVSNGTLQLLTNWFLNI